MTKTIKALLLGAAVCTLPLSASAIAVTYSLNGAGPAFATNGQNFNVSDGDTLAFSGQEFIIPDTMYTFNFLSGTTLTATLTPSASNAPALTFTAPLETDFSIMADFSNLVGTANTGGFSLSFVDNNVGSIPLPAGGVLLLTALGAAGLVRRRKS